jgi:predicted nucleic acid-binding protein
LFALALRYGLGAYDAVYLDLALRRQLPLATQDAALREAALAAGVGVWMPG